MTGAALGAGGRGADEEQMTMQQDDVATAGGDPSTAAPRAVLAPGTVRWERSYDRAAVERFAAEVEAHRARLQAEIDAARAASRAAELRAGAEVSTTPADLTDLVLGAQRELEALEREHEATVASIRAAAETEASRILDAARAEVEAVRATASAMSQLVEQGGADPVGDAVPAPVEAPPMAAAPCVDAG